MRLSKLCIIFSIFFVFAPLAGHAEKKYFSCSLINGSTVNLANAYDADLNAKQKLFGFDGNPTSIYSSCSQIKQFSSVEGDCLCTGIGDKKGVYSNFTPKTDCDVLSAYLVTNKFVDPTTPGSGCVWKVPEGYKLDDAGDVTKKIQWKPLAPNLSINIPTIKPFTTEGLEKPDAEGNVHIPFIGQYAAGVYKYLLLIAGIIAAVRIFAGGFNYTIAGGDSQKIEEAKSGIAHALIGLVLVLGSYLLLYTINPDLVQFKSLKIRVIQTVNLPEPEDASGNDPASGNPQPLCNTVETCKPYCQNQSNWSTLPVSGMIKESQTVDLNTINIVGIKTKSGTRVSNNLIKPLKKAGLAANQAGYTLYVSTAYRPLAKQLEQACPSILEGEKSKFVAWPGGSNHGSGRAVDIYLQTKNGKILSAPAKSTIQNNTEYQPYNKKLAEIMYGTGWKRLKIEVWHFEYPNTPIESSRTTTCFETSC
ncbi:MAG: D-alanyl-D-alanine carboxypeptidase family protein [Candidatus Magasanikbacteria bacterium]|nr:D-alanyl-D-alanine carboxypeptidase family protein [Candidatus Magasanikbacteria bacterium]